MDHNRKTTLLIQEKCRFSCPYINQKNRVGIYIGTYYNIKDQSTDNTAGSIISDCWLGKWS